MNIALATLNPKTADPFPAYEQEIARLQAFLHGLDESGWDAPSHCAGWTVKDVAAHLASIEVYNEACLDGKLRELDFSGSLDDSNEQGVAKRRRMKSEEVLAEWERRQSRIRDEWGRIGLDCTIQTSVGPYRLGLQVLHHAREYAIHADDTGVPVPATECAARLRWRTVFGVFAANEEGKPMSADIQDGAVNLKHGQRVHRLDSKRSSPT